MCLEIQNLNFYWVCKISLLLKFCVGISSDSFEFWWVSKWRFYLCFPSFNRPLGESKQWSKLNQPLVDWSQRRHKQIKPSFSLIGDFIDPQMKKPKLQQPQLLHPLPTIKEEEAHGISKQAPAAKAEEPISYPESKPSNLLTEGIWKACFL